MEWKINIENKKNLRIFIRFDPINGELVFIGEYKERNKEWLKFTEMRKPLWLPLFKKMTSELSVNVKNVLISADEIQNALAETYDKLIMLVQAFEELNEGLVLLSTIEIKEESKME